MKTNKEKKMLDLGKDPIGSLLFHMSLPSVVAMLVMSLYNVVDTFWIGKISPEAIAALTICFPIQILFGSIGMGTGVGAGSFASRMFGAGNHARANGTAGQIIFLAAFFGILIILSCTIFCEPVLCFFGAPEHILPLSRMYLEIVVFGTPFLFFMMMSDSLFRAEGNPNVPMFVIVTSAILNAILDPFLIFGWGPFPEMGIRGAAVATVISQFSAFFLSVYFLFSHRSGYHVRFRDIIPRWSIIVPIYQVGFPSFLTHIAMSAVLVIYNHKLGDFGHLAIATLGLGFRINGVLMMILFGIGHGVMPMTGFNYGARNYDRIKEIARVSTKFSALIGGVSFLLVEIFARPLLAAFTHDPELLAIAVPGLRIYIATQILVGPMIAWINLLLGMGKGLASMMLLIGRQFLFVVPLVYLLPIYFGLDGVWLAQPLSNIISFTVILLWTELELRRLKKAEPAAFPIAL
ncbi:MAG TPA: MATE family efflux transporter [Syntrophales bacterium]|nr:MATE family efflux transporter [Syntrophales bacterium]HPQ45628.1 MATE family efflux transporter [Syntrophales bacterium]